MSSKNRKARLERATATVEKIWRLQRMRLAKIETEISALKAEERSAFVSLGTTEPSLTLYRIAQISNRRGYAERERDDALLAAREQGRRAKQCQKLLAEAAEALRREETSTNGYQWRFDDVSAR